MIGKMRINNTNRVPLKNAPTITHNVNLSFEIGTSHVYPTDTNETVLEDVEDGVDARAQNDTKDIVFEEDRQSVMCATFLSNRKYLKDLRDKRVDL